MWFEQDHFQLALASLCKLTLKRLLKNMTQNKTMLRLTSDELNALAEATEVRFGESREVPRGLMVRLLAEDYLNGEDQ